MYELMCTRIDDEFGVLFESFNGNIEIALAQLEEERVSFMESKKSDENSGGLVGFFKTIINTIKKLIGDILDKSKKFLFGAKKDDNHANDQINLEKDPKLLVKFINEDFKDAKQVIKDLLDGKITVEDVKDFVRKQDNKLSAISSCTMAAASLYGTSVLHNKFLDKWKAEADDMYEQLEGRGINKFAEKYANASQDSNKISIAKEGGKILAAHLKQVTEYGAANLILNPMKKLYQSKYITNRIQAEGDAMNSKSGFRKLEREKKKKTRELQTTAKRELDQKDRRDENAAKSRKLTKRQNAAKRQLNFVRNMVYNDTDYTV